METIKINDIEYVKKEEYDKIESAKLTETIQKDLMVLDACNVLGIIPLTREQQKSESDLIEIKSFEKFKKFEKKVKYQLDDKYKPDAFYLDSSKYSFEFLKRAIDTAKAWGFESKPEFFKGFKDEKFMEDYPCLIKIEKLCFILAPRVEE